MSKVAILERATVEPPNIIAHDKGFKFHAQLQISIVCRSIINEEHNFHQSYSFFATLLFMSRMVISWKLVIFGMVILTYGTNFSQIMNMTSVTLGRMHKPRNCYKKAFPLN